jgi:adenosylmethionine-8-amino-7-oxononanoate aminotransferase
MNQPPSAHHPKHHSPTNRPRRGNPYDTTGRRYLHGSGAPAAFSIGHGNPEANAAIARQIERSHADTDVFFSSEPFKELTNQLLTLLRPFPDD